MSAKHTPAPWRWSNGYHQGLIGSEGRIVAQSLYHMSSIHLENHADKPLIAAAPELLAACKRLLTASLISGPKEFCDARDACEAAIAKAEGTEGGTE